MTTIAVSWLYIHLAAEAPLRGVPVHLTHKRATLSGEIGDGGHSWICNYSTFGKPQVVRTRGCCGAVAKTSRWAECHTKRFGVWLHNRVTFWLPRFRRLVTYHWVLRCRCDMLVGVS